MGVRLVDRTTRQRRPDRRRGAAQRELAGRAAAPRRRPAHVGEHPELRLGFTWLLPSELVRRAAAAFRPPPGASSTLVRRDDRSAGVAPAARPTSPIIYGRVPAEGALRVVELGSEQRVAAVSRGHALARRRRLHWAEIAEHPLVVNAASGTVDPSLWPAGARPDVAVRCRTYDEWIEMVAAGAVSACCRRRPASARTPACAT